jgi:predicted phosphate transport protein (TIGR00153 family)
MLEKLMPKSDEFFDDFDAQAEVTVRGAKLLLALFEDFTDIERKVAVIKQVEHEGDDIAHRAFERLHKQFITPFDRAEIHRLLGRIDDVLDLTDTTAERLLLYEVGAVPQAAKDLARILVPATEKMQEAIRLLRDIKHPAQILAACREIKRLEGDADALGRAAIAALFKSGADALSIIKWKEIYDLMETATDRCEDVANVIEGVVLEHA